VRRRRLQCYIEKLLILSKAAHLRVEPWEGV